MVDQDAVISRAVAAYVKRDRRIPAAVEVKTARAGARYVVLRDDEDAVLAVYKERKDLMLMRLKKAKEPV